MSARWPTTPLSDLVVMGSGGTPRASEPAYYEGGSIPWAVIGDLTDGTVAETARKVTHLGLDESSAKMVPRGSLLIGMYGSIGKLGITSTEMATNQAIAFLIPGPRVTVEWLFFCLLQDRHNLQRAGKGAAQQNISQTVLRDWPIPVPSLAMQLEIVSAMERAKNFEVASLQAASRVRRRVDALMASARLQEFTSAPMVRLSDILEGIEAGRSFQCLTRPAGAQEWGVIKVSAMTWGFFRPEENKAIPPDRDPEGRFEIAPGDLLVSRANTEKYVGAPVLVPSGCRPRLLLSDKSLRLRPRGDVAPEWLAHVMASPSVRSSISATATGTKDSMRNISQSALFDLQVPRPSTVACQRKQVARLDSLHEQTIIAGRALLDLDRKTAAVMRSTWHLLTGGAA